MSYWLTASDPGAGFGFTYNVAVPEPSTWAMMLLGFAGLGYAGYSRSKRTPHLPSVPWTPVQIATARQPQPDDGLSSRRDLRRQ